MTDTDNFSHIHDLEGGDDAAEESTPMPEEAAKADDDFKPAEEEDNWGGISKEMQEKFEENGVTVVSI